ncbi:Quinolinate synthase A [Candidatus Hydrogenisulfobacillus filiaventi]|uniref:Quinolinate synthase n=1 Tax=Candidatus Hydrogenisulfobacillus filiaventi TaxID=2707344 RepID=A0A6F8ZJZ9_9FIRM|nr:Quinolinate synthase A [Candidatus Hydrogenisulfobacillus filiaventi]
MALETGLPATGEEARLIAEIQELKRERDALILAHNYELGPVQDIADATGDSLALARYAQKSSARTLVMCGVYFMAETASILCPDKTVLIPDPEAGCTLADAMTPEQLLAWKAEYPDAVVVSYVNTSAAVKALSDYCCTSANAVDVVRAIDPDRPVLFGPDFFLGSYVARVTGRPNLHVWPGECHVHAAILPEKMEEEVARNPGSELLVHPECGCTTRALALPPRKVAARVLSTDGMLRYARESSATTFVVATELGLLHRLRKENPGKAFLPAHEGAVCPFMKMITLEKIRDALRDNRYEVRVPDDIRQRALLPLERMVAISPPQRHDI